MEAIEGCAQDAHTDARNRKGTTAPESFSTASVRVPGPRTMASGLVESSWHYKGRRQVWSGIPRSRYLTFVALFKFFFP